MVSALQSLIEEGKESEKKFLKKTDDSLFIQTDDLFEKEDDQKKAIDGFTTYLATEKLGDEVLKVLDSPMGSVENHEGVVIRDENIADVPFKITGKFILGGLVSDF